MISEVVLDLKSVFHNIGTGIRSIPLGMSPRPRKRPPLASRSHLLHPLSIAIGVETMQIEFELREGIEDTLISLSVS